MGRLSAVILFFVFLSVNATAQQWAVSTNGNCIYDRSGNVISCQSNSACKFVATGATRTGSYYVCDFYWGFCWTGHYETYTETYFITECPVDELVLLLALPLASIGMLKISGIRKLSISPLALR